MRTKAPKTAPAAVDTAPAGNEASSAFHALLQRQVQTNNAPGPVKAEGIAIGTLVQVNTDGGHIQVQIPSLGLGPMPAVSMVPLGPDHVGRSLALGFEGADARRPIVLGLMMQAPAPEQATEPAPDAGHTAVQVTHNGRRVVVQAHTELELRCGDAVILLSQDGNIQIRGAYVTTHASASNRIRGGSVQIN